MFETLDFGKLFKVADVLGNKSSDYKANKRRAAVVAYEGFYVGDSVTEYRPVVHAVSGAMAVAFAGLGWVRRERGTEALCMWFGLSAFFAAVSWYTREVENTGGPTAIESGKAWLDAKAAQLDKDDPGWDDRTMARVFG